MNTHKVIWQEGMLLRPQHFQHNDRYYDHQMKTRTQLLGGYTWGFLNLEIDLQFLNMGKLVISEASGILPDGSLFELGGNTEPLALDVPPNTGNTPIYLALPLVTGNHIEARRPEQSDVLARYTAYDAEVADSNTGDDSWKNATSIWCIGKTKTKWIHNCNWAGAHRQNIANDATNTSCGALIWLDKRGVVVGFNFECDCVVLSDIYNTSIFTDAN